MALRTITPPTEDLLTLEEMKVAVKLEPEDNEDDDYLVALGRAAQAQVEAMTQRRYCAQVLEWVLDGWCDRLVLPVAPGGDSAKAAISSVKYVDLAAAQQTLDPATMYWDRPAGPTRAIVRQWTAVWPVLGDAAERVVIRFAITSTAADASEGVKTAAKLLVSHWYRNRDAVVGVDNRDSSTPLPFGVEELLSAERWIAP